MATSQLMRMGRVAVSTRSRTHAPRSRRAATLARRGAATRSALRPRRGYSPPSFQVEALRGPSAVGSRREAERVAPLGLLAALAARGGCTRRNAKANAEGGPLAPAQAPEITWRR